MKKTALCAKSLMLMLAVAAVSCSSGKEEAVPAAATADKAATAAVNIRYMQTRLRHITISQKISRKHNSARSTRLTTHSVHVLPNCRSSATRYSRKSTITDTSLRRASSPIRKHSTRSRPKLRIILQAFSAKPSRR